MRSMVAEWNATAVSTVMRSEREPLRTARAMATVHIAMFEAMNFIAGRYASRVLVRPAAPLGMSGSAVAAATAHYVLVEMYPGRKAALDQALERSFAAIPDDREKSNARIWGRQLGAIVLAAMEVSDSHAASGDCSAVSHAEVVPARPVPALQ